MEAVLDTAKLTSKGQVTIPKAIRSLLGLKAGGRVLLASAPDGTVQVRNATLQAFDDARAAFVGAATEAGLETDEDVAEMIRDIRYDRSDD